MKALTPVHYSFIFRCWALWVLCFAQARAKSVLGFLQDIVLQTGRRLNDAAMLKKNDTTALITPFATSTFNAEFKCADE